MPSLWWLENKDTLLKYLHDEKIVLQCWRVSTIVTIDGVGEATCFSFILKKSLKHNWWGRPPARIIGRTKKKALTLLGLDNTSSLEECAKVNREIALYGRK